MLSWSCLEKLQWERLVPAHSDSLLHLGLLDLLVHAKAERAMVRSEEHTNHDLFSSPLWSSASSTMISSLTRNPPSARHS